MEKKLAELTEKIYQEGVVKGEAEKKTILEAAEKEAAALKETARTEAAGIVAAAEAKAAELKRNAESEIKLSSRQALSALKQQLVDILTSKALDKDISAALDNKEVIENSILEICRNWTDRKASLEVLLSESKSAELATSLESKIKKVLDGSVTITPSKNISSGFKIGPAGGTYKLSLTDDDFMVFFKEYLRPATKTLLFGE